ncbi:MAG: TraX family protein [Oscillospiraceae bacterium]|jgi:hypothetical protein
MDKMTAPCPGKPAAYPGFSGSLLKRIAVVSMVLDHVGSFVTRGVYAPYMKDGYMYFSDRLPLYVRVFARINPFLEALGMLAIPIFCFLLAEGFVHTRSPLKYALRLGIFALLSEAPYDLAHFGKFCDFKLQNVMFTLLVCLLTLIAMDFARKRFSGGKPKTAAAYILCWAAGCGLVYLIKAEYVFLAVTSVSLFYLLRQNRFFRLSGVAPLIVASPWALLSAAPILLYNGERGTGSKYFFYIFYPAHYLAIWAIAKYFASL